MPSGIAKKLPAGSALAALRLAVSPIPKLMVPDITVSTSDAGCVCGAIAYPAGNLSRRANRPALVGSPKNIAPSAPAGSAFGPGPHLTSLGEIITCASLAEATHGTPTIAIEATARISDNV